MKKHEKIVVRLNKLLILNYEAERTFLSALDEVNNTTLKNFFRVAAYERHEFIRVLDVTIRQIGGTPTYPEEPLSSNAVLSSELKEIISAKNGQLLLTEIGKMKVLDIENYQRTLNTFEFPEAINNILKDQQDTIVRALYSIDIHKDMLIKNPQYLYN